MMLMMLAPCASIISIIQGEFLHETVRGGERGTRTYAHWRPLHNFLFTLPAVPAPGRSPLNNTFRLQVPG